MTVIDESLTAKGFTPRNQVPLVYGRPRTIDAITIHWWGLYGQTHDGINAFFCTTGPGATSAHFVVSGIPYPRINCIVNPWDAAWHAGNAVGNATTIGIECRPEATDADYAVVAETVRFLRDTYGLNLPLIPHRDWQATQCPGNYDLGRIHRMAEALKFNPPVVQPPKPPTGEVVNLTYDRDVINPAGSKTLTKGVMWTLKKPDMATNWNLADEDMGLGYYDIDLFLQGTGLLEGESLTIQILVVTQAGTENMNKSGYFTQEIFGTKDGVFKGSVRFKSPLLSSAQLWVDVTASADCKLDVWGADTYKFEK